MARNPDPPKLTPALDESQADDEENIRKNMPPKYRLMYLGRLAVDRRYTPIIVQWVAREVSRVRKNRPSRIDFSIETDRLIITNVEDGGVLESIALSSVVRLPRLKNQPKTLTFVSGGRMLSDQCYCHVFACETQEMVGILSEVTHIRFQLFPV